jgi:nicotinate-nucleotide pyrophosphorylase (carboxylating)
MADAISKRVLELALKQDIGRGDITSNAVIDKTLKVKAVVHARGNGILAGVEEACFIFKNAGLKIQYARNDGARIKKGDIVLGIFGDARAILKVERTALNILSRMSGIATFTKKMLAYSMPIAATRKCPPGMQLLDKKAVAIAGGLTHRRGLYDGILIKDNHIDCLMKQGLSRKEAIELSIKRAKNRYPRKRIEFEARTVKDSLIAAHAGASVIMLDNFSVKNARKAIKGIRSIKKRNVIELSGGITPENIRSYAALDADFLSMGRLTNAAGIIDMSLDIL